MDINIKLNKPQKMIFLMAFTIVFIIVVFWLFIYNPAKRRMTKLERELATIQSEINKIEKISGGEEKLDIAYEKFYKIFTDLKRMIPTEERSTLSALSSEANRMGIDVLAIKPTKARESNLAIIIKGNKILEMPISMDIRCDYMTLGEYLHNLREKFPTLIRVDAVDISRPKGKDISNLNINLDITLFMLGG